ncbi:hypothetical protein TorRG33x02_304990 [Trema orientale]|uniref:Uncharacterized protein n=1 Tax=Trema orientale TaxID=63057 RepID=A0A2P5BXU5_TREOI|nr:hypothetical protein TorRG33x02_304990 [Trema orientale]
MLGEWMGDFIEVDDPSLMEGWGPYMRIRVFNQYTAFLELEDQGVMHTLPYGPWMLGASLRGSGLDHYASDFSRVGAWLFLTRLTRNSIGPSLTQLPMTTSVIRYRTG